MEINFSSKINNYPKHGNEKINFEAGLTPKMRQEINYADVLEISNNLAKKGIATDFKNNKVIAWGSQKAIEIIEQLNKKFTLKLGYPKGIYVEDFNNLNINNDGLYGFCNFFPTNLRKNSINRTPEKIVFFNTFETLSNNISEDKKWLTDWNNINEIADYRFVSKETGTDNFLYIFLHEFFHASHEENLIKKIGGQKSFEKFKLYQDESKIEEFKNNYQEILEQISMNATKNPFEAIANDIPIRVVNTLDSKTLIPIKNPFINSPYEKQTLLKRKPQNNQVNENKLLNHLLKQFWNGKFD